MEETEALSRVDVVAYDPTWPESYATERARIIAATDSGLLELEHIGSTAVPNLSAKPIIDMMGAVGDLDTGQRLLPTLEALGYHLIETGMTDRFFLRRRGDNGLAFQLHIVEQRTWDNRHERLMRDYLLNHPDDAAAYGALKGELAKQYVEDSLAYTKAKTDFIQHLVDKACADLGRPSIDVWTD